MDYFYSLPSAVRVRSDGKRGALHRSRIVVLGVSPSDARGNRRRFRLSEAGDGIAAGRANLIAGRHQGEFFHVYLQLYICMSLAVSLSLALPLLVLSLGPHLSFFLSFLLSFYFFGLHNFLLACLLACLLA